MTHDSILPEKEVKSGSDIAYLEVLLNCQAENAETLASMKYVE